MADKIESKEYKITERKRPPKNNGRNKKKDKAEGEFKHSILRPIIGVAISVVVVCVIFTLAIKLTYNHYVSPVDKNDTETIEVTIKRGSGLSSISKTLEENGIIRSATAFKFYVDFSDMSSKLLAGTFELSPSMTFDEIVNVLKRPTSINDTMKITFVEGSTAEAMAKNTVNVGLFKNDKDYLAAARTGDAFASYDFISEVIVTNGKTNEKREYVLEGYLFPDTYEVYTETDAQTVIGKQLARFSQIYTDEYKQRAQQLGMTTDQVITLASIIEKEGTGDDMAKISAVFHNRLNANMPLQSDATIMYVLKENRLVVTAEDTSVDSPYNTYRRTGLPIGPICNPSQAAIEAALWPDNEIMQGGYMYFCLGDPETGEVIYSKTLEEHAAVQAKYKDKWAEHDRKNQQAANGG